MLPISIKTNLNLPETDYLKQKISAVFCETGLPKNISKNLEKEVFGKYSEPHRTYHNLSHIFSLFKILETSETQPEHPLVFQLAIIFHDIIYEIGKKDNEAKSAAFAIETLGDYLKGDDLKLLVKMIESTAAHQPLSPENDTRLFLDFDLAVLAAPADVYGKYANAIRQEFSRYPTWMYRYGRRKVLRYFLQKERIYLTDHFYKKHETQARANLQSELKNLKSLFS